MGVWSTKREEDSAKDQMMLMRAYERVEIIVKNLDPKVKKKRDLLPSTHQGTAFATGALHVQINNLRT